MRFLNILKSRLLGDLPCVLTPTTHSVTERTRSKRPKRGSVVTKNRAMLDPDCYGSHNHGQEAVAEYTKGSRREFSTGNAFSGRELGGHNQFLHVPPSQIGRLQPAEAGGKLGGLFEEFRVVGKSLGKENIDTIIGIISEGNVAR